ncbi:MAG: hypothetical protein HY805_00210 [Nitrospirae bacterium]|nr:hypothetical protein [Nitrospirota bacterium]
MAEVNLAITAKDNATSKLSAIERSIDSLGKAFNHLKESSSASKYVEASVFGNPKFLDYILKLAPAAISIIDRLLERFKDNKVEETIKSIEPAVSKIKDFKSPVEELSGAMKTLIDHLKPVKEHFESINRLIAEIKKQENAMAIFKDFQKAIEATGAYVDFSELEGVIFKLKEELSYRTGYDPTAFDSLDASEAIKKIKELHEKIKEPISLNLDPENFFHNLQSAWDTFRNVRERIITPIALSLDMVIKYMTLASPIKPFSEGIEYIRSKMESLPIESTHIIRHDVKADNAVNQGLTVNYNPQITINTLSSNIRELERVLSERLSYERGELSRTLKKVVS